MGSCCSSEPPPAGIDGPSRPEQMPLNPKDSRGQRAVSTYPPDSIEDQWIRAIQDNDNKKIKHLFKQHHKSVKFLKIKLPNGDNSLHTAIRANNRKLSRFLLILKINVNETNPNNGNTALHYAVLNSKAPLVELLISNKKIDLGIRNGDHKTAMQIAKESSNKEIIGLLQKSLDDDSMIGANLNQSGHKARRSDFEFENNENDNKNKNTNKNNNSRNSIEKIPTDEDDNDDDGGNNNDNDDNKMNINETTSKTEIEIEKEKEKNNDNDNKNRKTNKNIDMNEDNDKNENDNINENRNENGRRDSKDCKDSKDSKDSNYAPGVTVETSATPERTRNSSDKVDSYDVDSNLVNDSLNVNNSTNDTGDPRDTVIVRKDIDEKGNVVVDESSDSKDDPADGTNNVNNVNNVNNRNGETIGAKENGNQLNAPGAGAGAGAGEHKAKPPSTILNMIDQSGGGDDHDGEVDEIDAKAGNNGLPILQGFLEKKKPKPPYNWQKRWVQVNKPYVFWSDKKLHIQDVNNEKERKKANGFVEFSNINSITAKKSKSEQNKFILNVNNGKSKDTRDIMFRCDTEKVRNKWVEGLQKYLEN